MSWVEVACWHADGDVNVGNAVRVGAQGCEGALGLERARVSWAEVGSWVVVACGHADRNVNVGDVRCDRGRCGTRAR